MSKVEMIAKELGFRYSSPLEIQPGDFYLARKNTGPKILTCKSNNVSFITPVEKEYCYNLSDCVKLF